MKLPDEIVATIRYDERELREYILPIIVQAMEQSAEGMQSFTIGLANLAETINRIGDDMRTGRICGERPRYAKFNPSAHLADVRTWRRCKREFTQVKWDRLPRGER